MRRSILPCSSLVAFDTTLGTPSSLQLAVAIIDASMLLPIATTTTSHSPNPASSRTCGCVASPWTAVENSFACCIAGRLRSISRTSAPAFESDSASDIPKRPAPIIPIRFMS